MNYSLIYDSLIQKAQSENRKKGQGVYFEKHHIIPKCLGGSNHKHNLVLLTAKEHFVCHKILYFLYPENNKIFHAYYLMTRVNGELQQRQYKISSREYQRTKIIFSENQKGSKNHMAGKSGWNKGLPKELQPFYNKTSPFKGLKGENHFNYNQRRSEETRRNISDSQKRIPKIYCEYCNTHVNILNYRRWHGNNCKKSLFYKEEIVICPYCEFKTTSRNINYNKYHGDNCCQKPDYKLEDHLIKCPYCVVTGTNISNMKRYHFDNCKHKNRL